MFDFRNRRVGYILGKLLEPFFPFFRLLYNCRTLLCTAEGYHCTPMDLIEDLVKVALIVLHCITAYLRPRWKTWLNLLLLIVCLQFLKNWHNCFFSCVGWMLLHSRFFMLWFTGPRKLPLLFRLSSCNGKLQFSSSFFQLTRAYFAFLEVMFSSHFVFILNLDTNTFMHIVGSLESGLKGLDTNISSQVFSNATAGSYSS